MAELDHRTRISYMHGVEDRLKDAPKQVAPKRVFNYHLMTEGEFSLMLLDDRLEMARQYYGDQKGNFQLAKNLIFQSINKGLHTGSGVGMFSRSIPRELDFVVDAIRRSKKGVKPSAGILMKPQSGIFGPNDAFDPDAPLIKAENCGQYIIQYDDPRDNPNFDPFGPNNTDIEFTEEYYRCRERNKFISLLNDKWEETSPYLMYEFISTFQTQKSNIAASKATLQKLGLSSISQITGLNRNNLREWTVNGIMRSNVKEGIEPLSPEESIEQIIIGGESGDPRIRSTAYTYSVNGLFTTVVALVTVIAKAIDIAKSLKNNLGANTEQFVAQQLKEFGLPEIAAGPEDWACFLPSGEPCPVIQNGSDGTLGQNSTTKGSSDILGLGLLAGYFFLNK